MPQLKPYKNDYYLWQYVPSLAASIIFLILFTVTTTFHCWKSWKTRARFCIPFCIGGLFEMIGFIARAVCFKDTAELIAYCIQSVFILLGPVLFAASVYMTLARLIKSVDAERYSLVRIKWLTKTFVTGDVVAFLVQGTGAGMMAMGGSMAGIAKGITIAGLVIQIVMFGIFIFVSVVLEKRMDACSTVGDVAWKRHLYSLYTISALIMARSIFRVIEYAMGQEGYLLSHEWPMYIFDSLLMFAVMVMWGVRSPTTIQQPGFEDQVVNFDDVHGKA